jgi:hypothetical protein
MKRLTRVAGIVIGLQFTLQADSLSRKRRERLESRACIALTTTAVAQARRLGVTFEPNCRQRQLFHPPNPRAVSIPPNILPRSLRPAFADIP